MSRKHYFMQSSKKEAEKPDDEGMVVNRFSDIQKVDARRHEVLDYMMMGYDTEEIAEYLGESKEVINQDMKKIMELGYKAREDDLDEVRDEIMRTYRLSKKEAYRAFKLSQGEVSKVVIEEDFTREDEKNPDGTTMTSRKTTTEQSAGDPRFLNVMIDSAKEMGKVTGAQKHKEIDVQNSINNNTMNILSPNRTKMPSDFDKWTKKPEDKEVPEAEGIKSEDL